MIDRLKDCTCDTCEAFDALHGFELGIVKPAGRAEYPPGVPPGVPDPFPRRREPTTVPIPRETLAECAAHWRAELERRRGREFSAAHVALSHEVRP